MSFDFIFFVLFVIAATCFVLLVRKNITISIMILLAGLLPFVGYLNDVYSWPLPENIELIFFYSGFPLFFLSTLLVFFKKMLSLKKRILFAILSVPGNLIAIFVVYLIYAISSIP